MEGESLIGVATTKQCHACHLQRWQILCQLSVQDYRSDLAIQKGVVVYGCRLTCNVLDRGMLCRTVVCVVIAKPHGRVYDALVYDV